MYNLKQRVTVGIATFAIAASTLGVVPAVAFADEATTGETKEVVEGTTTESGDKKNESDTKTETGDTTTGDTTTESGEKTDGEKEAEEAKTWNRIKGKTALDTMLEIVKAGKDGGQFGIAGDGIVIVASAEGYWDALAASSIAGANKSPVILTASKELSEQAKEALKLLDPAKIIVAGGDEAVSDDVLKALKEFGEVERISGATAADTANKIYEKSEHSESKIAFIATSETYQDALAIAPYANKANAPIFLTVNSATPEGRILNDDSIKAIKEGGFETVIIVGGDEMVSTKVDAQLEEIKVQAYGRLKGATALETSAEIAKWELEKAQGMILDTLSVASSSGYWDALAGAALAGQQNSVLILANVEGGYNAIDAIYKGNEAKVVNGQVFGGDEAISDATLDYLNKLADEAKKAEEGDKAEDKTAEDEKKTEDEAEDEKKTETETKSETKTETETKSDSTTA